MITRTPQTYDIVISKNDSYRQPFEIKYPNGDPVLLTGCIGEFLVFLNECSPTLLFGLSSEDNDGTLEIIPDTGVISVYIPFTLSETLPKRCGGQRPYYRLKLLEPNGDRCTILKGHILSA